MSELTFDIENLYIEVDQVFLRRLDKDDFNDFYEYASSDLLAMMIGWPSLKNKNMAFAVFDRLYQNRQTFALIDIETKKMIGHISLESLSQVIDPLDFYNQIGLSLSFALKESYQQKGIMTKSLMTVLDFIFSSLNIDFVNCGYFFFNEASKRLQQNLGFHYYRQHLVSRFGLTIPTIENVLMKDEWMKILR